MQSLQSLRSYGPPTDATVLYAQINLHPPGHASPIRIQACGLQRLEIVTPSISLDRRLAESFPGLQLADLDFFISRSIDLVLGADAYSRLILPGVVHWEGLVAQKTVVGWTITGKTWSSASSQTALNCTATLVPEHEPWHEVLIGLLRKFWAIEEVLSAVRQSPDDIRCEAIYATGHSPSHGGRYRVPLPMRPEHLNLISDGLDNAQRALSATHRRMRRDPHLRDEYVKFMRDYLEVGHMRLLNSEEIGTRSGPITIYRILGSGSVKTAVRNFVWSLTPPAQRPLKSV